MNMQQVKLADRRYLKRFSVRLKVYSQDTDEVLGYIVNLNSKGMMITSLIPLPEKKEIRICFGTCDTYEKPDRIFLTVYSIWSSFTESVPRLYCTGLHYVNPSDEVLDRIRELIDYLGPQVVD